MHRHALPLLLVAALLVSGCGSDEPPLVTFGVAGQERSTGPTQYCDLQLRDCKGDAGAEVTLPVPVGTNVRIHVPDEVSQAPWHVVFSYRSPAGQQVDDRSPVFARPDSRTTRWCYPPRPTSSSPRRYSSSGRPRR